MTRSRSNGDLPGSPEEQAKSPEERGTAPPEEQEPTSSKEGGGDLHGLDRREFLRRTGLGAGALATGGGLPGLLASCRDDQAVPLFGRSPDVVVVGAGAFGGWTALHLRQMGARVTLVDLYGPGNSRSSSGDETRGVRSSYGDRELWVSWANRAIDRWTEFDRQWGERLGVQHFHSAGDLILRDRMDTRMEESAETWDRLGIPYEVLGPEEVSYRWPQFDTTEFEVGLYEPRAGVVKARRACESVAEIFRRQGGRIRIAGATPGAASGGRLQEVDLTPGAPLGAELFVFALGPWFPKAFPELMGDKIRIPMGNVYYYGPPPGDESYLHPHLPSFGFPGVTGWPSLPPDHHGMRVRTGGQLGEDPDTSRRVIPEEEYERPRRILSDYIPGMADQPVVKTHVCHYEASPDRQWIIDRHPEWENVWIAGAGNAEAFKFGPVLGEYIAARVLGRDRHPELAERFRLSEDRFA